MEEDRLKLNKHASGHKSRAAYHVLVIGRIKRDARTLRALVHFKAHKSHDLSRVSSQLIGGCMLYLDKVVPTHARLPLRLVIFGPEELSNERAGLLG